MKAGLDQATWQVRVALIAVKRAGLLFDMCGQPHDMKDIATKLEALLEDDDGDAPHTP